MSSQTSTLRTFRIGLQPFLAIPPFPSAKFDQFSPGIPSNDTENDRLESLASLRRAGPVGGTYWAALPGPSFACALVRSAGLVEESKGTSIYLPVAGRADASAQSAAKQERTVVTRANDPWFIPRRAGALSCNCNDHAALIAHELVATTRDLRGNLIESGRGLAE